MSQADRLFRKAALDRLSSPEELDAQVRLITLKSWLLLAPLAIVVVAGLGWSIFGTIPVKLAGQGIIVQRDGVLDVVADTSGRVRLLHVDVGTRVEAGTPLLEVSRPDFEERLRLLDSRIAALRERKATSLGFVDRGRELSSAAFARQKTLLESQRSALRERIRVAQERVRVQEELLAQGLATRSAVLSARQEATALELELEATAARLQDIASDSLQADKTRDQERASVTYALDEALREREALTDSRNHAIRVVSPVAGRVIEVKTAVGSLIAPGAPVIGIERTGAERGELEAVVYVGSAEGKKITAAMKAEVMPATVKREEFGFVRGEVRYVSAYPVTPAAVHSRLQNDAVARAVAGNAQAPLELRVGLQAAQTSSGLQWSTRNGPSRPVQAGTLCKVEVIVERQRPITLLIPALARIFD